MKKTILTCLIVPLYNVVALCTLTFGYYVHVWYINFFAGQPMLVDLSCRLFGVLAMCYAMVFIGGEILAFAFCIFCFVGGRNPDCASLRDFWKSISL